MNEEKKERLKTYIAEPRKIKMFTTILLGSKLLVFAALLYTSMAMFNLGREIEGIILLFTVALWLILNQLDNRG